MKKWYHVIKYSEIKPVCFGFAVIDGIVVDAPNWNWKGMPLSEIRYSFKKGDVVIEIKTDNII